MCPTLFSYDFVGADSISALLFREHMECSPTKLYKSRITYLLLRNATATATVILNLWVVTCAEQTVWKLQTSNYRLRGKKSKTVTEAEENTSSKVSFFATSFSVFYCKNSPWNYIKILDTSLKKTPKWCVLLFLSIFFFGAADKQSYLFISSFFRLMGEMPKKSLNTFEK